MALITSFVKCYTWATKLLMCLGPLVDLFIRLWLFKAFFFSGWLKTKNWQSTLTLFEQEYQVPLISPNLAAYFGTAAELTLPVFLVLGLFGRLSALALFIFNSIIFISYPFLWTDDGIHGLHQHITWGLLMLVIMAHGPGKLSIDYLLNKKCPKYEY